MKILAILLCLVLASEGVRVWWFSAARPSWEGEPVFACSFPPDAEYIDLRGTRTESTLHYDRAEAVRLSGPAGASWRIEAYYLEYNAGNRRAWRDLFGHSPDVCFPASGARLEKEFAPRTLEIDGQSLVFKHFLFRFPLSPGPIHAIKMVWLADMERYGMRGSLDGRRRARIGSALARQADPPGRQILATVEGVGSPDEAWALFASHVLVHCGMTDP